MNDDNMDFNTVFGNYLCALLLLHLLAVQMFTRITMIIVLLLFMLLYNTTPNSLILFIFHSVFVMVRTSF